MLDYKITDIKSYPQPEVIPFLNQKYFEMHVTTAGDGEEDGLTGQKRVNPRGNNQVKNKIVLYVFAFKDDHIPLMHNFFKNYHAEVEKRNNEEFCTF